MLGLIGKIVDGNYCCFNPETLDSIERGDRAGI